MKSDKEDITKSVTFLRLCI